MADKKRPSRWRRRAAEGDARELVRARQELALLEPGGGPDRPIEVVSSSVIEIRAASLPCPLCQGGLRVEEQLAHKIDGRSLREVKVTCGQCGIPRSLWFRIATPLLN